MIDAHFHRAQFATYFSHAAGEVRFYGCHPWQAADFAPDGAARLAATLAAEPRAGVGEIGLDRLRRPDAASRARQREVFIVQLEVAAHLRRPVVLHGAKCWGEVVQACQPFKGRIPAFLFHGFSRSGGLVRDMIALNGFISVGPALMNDHAVNYRALVAQLPPDRVLVETDLDVDSAGATHTSVCDGVYAQLAALRGLSVSELVAEIEANAARFLAAL